MIDCEYICRFHVGIGLQNTRRVLKVFLVLRPLLQIQEPIMIRQAFIAEFGQTRSFRLDLPTPYTPRCQCV